MAPAADRALYNSSCGDRAALPSCRHRGCGTPSRWDHTPKAALRTRPPHHPSQCCPAPIEPRHGSPPGGRLPACAQPQPRPWTCTVQFGLGVWVRSIRASTGRMRPKEGGVVFKLAGSPQGGKAWGSVGAASERKLAAPQPSGFDERGASVAGCGGQPPAWSLLGIRTFSPDGPRNAHSSST
eukprot:scaffold283800_cov30-Tisochrysis_lutea.AAC.3